MISAFLALHRPSTCGYLTTQGHVLRPHFYGVPYEPGRLRIQHPAWHTCTEGDICLMPSARVRP